METDDDGMYYRLLCIFNLSHREKKEQINGKTGPLYYKDARPGLTNSTTEISYITLLD